MAFLQKKIPLILHMLFLFFFKVAISSMSIHDLLKSKGLPAGLLPKEVKSYNLSNNGLLEVFLDGPCLAKFDTMALYDSVVKANLTYGSLAGVEGLSQQELFVWLPVKGIIVNDPLSGLILFDIGLAHKQLSLSLFEDPPHCKPDGTVTEHLLEHPMSSVVKMNGRKEKGFEDQ
ncbi:uncharacterized protein LOC107878729 isoform X2 [Capsicum annuum]|uniref:uncharacterized protein LOC107878729 isoform X2 n=1 Tax=Capsicum annuum TaxID=4072 RepID=UPI0007BEC47F|nr:uncharacterized protein LOC107878729 isoform X2 [Capsicum annuum]